MSLSRPVVSAIVVSYNTRRMTLDCLRALHADLADLPAEVWVVDNASTDGSVEDIRAEFPNVRLIANEQNLGFGAANNQAMKLARGEFLLLLNSDAFPVEGATRAMVDYLRRRTEVGVVGPKLLNLDGSMQRSCYRFPSPGQAWRENLWISILFANHPSLGDYQRWKHDHACDVEWVIGACLLARREVFERAGGFDERFFMYAEETDWQRRVRADGWRIAFFPGAQVTHLGGASGGGRSKISRHAVRSLDLYVEKHHGRIGLLSLHAAMVVGCTMRMFLWSAVLLIAPSRRAVAWSKAKLHSWLIVRQLTHWRVA